MFELTFLGTAASVPLIKRGLSSAVVAHDEYRMMVDCGEGTQRQVLMSGLGFRRLEHIFITHSHLDHILGLGGMLSTLGQWESVERLTIYAGATACEKIADLITKVVFRGARPPVAIEMKPVQPGVVLKAEDFDVVAFPVRHRGPDCFGYVFQEHSRRPFLNDKATELGVPLGPERKTLIAGKPITLSDGRIVQPNDVLGELQRGSKLVMTGDTGDTESLIKICKDADVLVTEATYLAEDIGLARDYGHSTAAEAATLAKNAGVGQLVLTHISGRYPENVIEAEARAIFPNTVVARDFDKFKIRAA
ncbi:MAG TPA: ribonuclease Z [Thermoflexales bacterium]|nr:ribonuclease Z [Thermoflexales bacterium]HQW36417.1 ribonuclease Z [Thermoflexales bacterium]HRA00244.1 ribonuclease Z [Thermoflexales bacterium]